MKSSNSLIKDVVMKKVAPHDSEVRRVRDSVFTSNTNLVDSSASSNIIWG